jgi:excisionase family DNA binding protein
MRAGIVDRGRRRPGGGCFRQSDAPSEDPLVTKPMTTAMLPPVPAHLLPVQVVAQRLGVSTKTVRRLIDRKAIVVHRIGRQIRISEPDLAAYVQSRREP